MKQRTQTTEPRIQTTDYKKQKQGLCSVLCALNSEEGIVLIISLLLLLVATVVGITALSTSTTNVMIAGNQRLSEINFSSADSGVSLSVPVIETTAYDKAVSSSYTSVVTDTSNFVNEISGASAGDSDTASASPDLQFSLGSDTSAVMVSIDIDYLYSGFSAGSAIEFASGYEGLGKGAGAGGAEIYYSVDSISAGVIGSETRVYAVYRYVTK